MMSASTLENLQDKTNASVCDVSVSSQTVKGNPRLSFQKMQNLVENSEGMDLKSCPVCKAQLFSDMETCFNCMYKFGTDPDLEKNLKEASEKSYENDSQKAGSHITAGADEPDVASMSSFRDAPSDAFEEKPLPAISGKCGHLSYDAGVDPSGTQVGGFNEECNEKARLKKDGPDSEFGEKRFADPDLFGEFLVEFEGFLRNFLLDHKVGIE